MRRVLAAFAIVLGMSLMAATVEADGGHRHGRSGPSVFPRHHDHWKSWGVRRELPRHVHVPHHGVRRGGVFIATPAPAPAWVPGQWWWDGWRWQWAPGHWAY